MAQLKLLKTASELHAVFSTNLTEKDIKTAKIANPKSLIVVENDKKVFEFDVTTPAGYTVLSKNGVVVPAPTDANTKITHLFNITGHDMEEVSYVSAVVIKMMKKVEAQVAEAVKEVRSVKIPVEEVTGE